MLYIRLFPLKDWLEMTGLFVLPKFATKRFFSEKSLTGAEKRANYEVLVTAGSSTFGTIRRKRNS